MIEYKLKVDDLIFNNISKIIKNNKYFVYQKYN